MTTNADSPDDLYDLLIEAIDALEQSWRSLNNAELAEYLPAPKHPHRVRVLAELVKIDQEHRWKWNEQKLLEQYLKEWPELTDNKAVVVDLLRAECVTRERFGRRARYFDIKRRFPEHHRYINLLAIHAEAKGRTASSRDEMEEADEQLLTPGYELAGFEIIDLLGSGGMALVYRANDVKLEREVAIKVPTFTHGPDLKTAERMLREARLAARIEHPHVCPILGADNTNGLAYIAMALIDGQPLSEWLDNHELPSPAAAHLIMKVAEALQKIHEAGIIHRDIKASNVMIDDRSEPILMDFGLAHVPDFESADEAVVQRTETVTPQPVDPKSRSWRTTASMFGGTVAYMAPERLQGKPADRQSDIYSLGVLFYQALTGRLPFLGDDMIEVSERILSSEPPLPRTFRPAIEPYLESICLKAMSRNIETRYPTAASLAKSIYGHLRRTGYLQPELRGRDSDQEKEEDTTTDRPPESRFGRYEIRQVHGSDGRFAEYVAYDTDLQRDVVLLVSSSIATEHNGDELLSAIKTISKSKHAGIGRVYDSGTIDGRAFITLPVARGEVLSAWRNRKDVTPKDLAGLLSKVALALNELVSVGIAPDYSQLESTLVNDRKEPVLSPLLAVSNASENRDNSGPHDSTPHDDVVNFGQRCYKILTGQEPPPVASPESRRAWRGTLLRKVEAIGYPLADICVRAMDDRPGHGYDTLAHLAEDLDACSRGRRKVRLRRLTHLFHGYNTLPSLAEARVAFSRGCRKLKVPRLKQLLVRRIRRVSTVLVLIMVTWLGARCLYNETLPPPEELMNVTLEASAGQAVQIIPIVSAGADVVNFEGKSREPCPISSHGTDGVETITLDCLPGTVARIFVLTDNGHETTWSVPLRREDNGQLLKLRVSGPCLYLNDHCLSIDFTELEDPETWEGVQLRPAEQQADGERTASSAKEVPATLRSVRIGMGNEYLPAVRWIRNSQVCIETFCHHSEESDNTPQLSSELVTAIADVHSQQLGLDSRSLALLDGRCESLENLTLAVLPGDDIPDLSGYRNLRFLTLLGEIDLSRIQRCKRLKALNVGAPSVVRNVKALRVLKSLQFLTFLASPSDESPHVLLRTISSLRSLQYLGAVFPPNTDFSFTRHMPFLQTLGIRGSVTQESLRTIVDAPNLKCLALTKTSLAASSDELAAFEKARHDLVIVEYEPGACLGSFWLAPLSAVVALLASLFRFLIQQRERKSGLLERPHLDHPQSAWYDLRLSLSIQRTPESP